MYRHFGCCRSIDSRIRRCEDHGVGLLSRLGHRLGCLPCKRTVHRSRTSNEFSLSEGLSRSDSRSLRSFDDCSRGQLYLYCLGIRSKLETVIARLISSDCNRSGSTDNQLFVLVDICDSAVRREVCNLQTTRCRSVEGVQDIGCEACRGQVEVVDNLVQSL